MSGQLERDHSGRNRLYRNVFAGWVAHGIAVVIGFVMPRLIYEAVGPVTLGIWDLGWSLLSYIAYSGLGMAAGVTHFVARYRAEGNDAEVAVSTATGWYCQLLLALLAGGAFIALFSTLPLWLPGLEQTSVETLVWMGLLLGATVAVVLAGDVFQGLLTGCHHSSRSEAVTITSDVVLALAMIGVLLAGGGLVGLAAVTLAVRAVFEVVRAVLARRVCPEARFVPSCWAGQRAADIARFGVKTSVGILQELLVHQLARLALVASVGPAALAAYSRYATLIRQIARTVERATLVIPPMTSGLVGLGREDDVRELGIKAANAAVLVLLPMVVTFAVLGDDLVTVWMGPEFVVPGLSWALAAMAFVHADRGAINQVLSGLNAHGRIALWCLACSLAVFGVMLLVLYPVNGLSAGILVAVSMGVGVSLPHFLLSARRLRLQKLKYVMEVYFKPLISNSIFLVFLLWARSEWRAGDWPEALALLAAAALVLAGAYWFYAFDRRMRERVREALATRLA